MSAKQLIEQLCEGFDTSTRRTFDSLAKTFKGYKPHVGIDGSLTYAFDTSAGAVDFVDALNTKHAGKFKSAKAAQYYAHVYP